MCLKWSSFQENISTSFENLRQTNDFSDVTLVSDDGDQIECHKVILAVLYSVKALNPELMQIFFDQGMSIKVSQTDRGGRSSFL